MHRLYNSIVNMGLKVVQRTDAKSFVRSGERGQVMTGNARIMGVHLPCATIPCDLINTTDRMEMPRLLDLLPGTGGELRYYLIAVPDKVSILRHRKLVCVLANA